MIIFYTLMCMLKMNGYTTSFERNGYYEYTTFRGDPTAVVQAVATLIRGDTVSQCYEHMLTRVHKTTIIDHSTIQVITIKNGYAGD